MNEWQVLMAVETRMRRGRSRYRPAEKPSWRRWISFAMRRWHCWGRVEMVCFLKELNQELEGLNSRSRELEATIAANVAGILEA